MKLTIFDDELKVATVLCERDGDQAQFGAKIDPLTGQLVKVVFRLIESGRMGYELELSRDEFWALAAGINPIVASEEREIAKREGVRVNN